VLLDLNLPQIPGFEGFAERNTVISYPRAEADALLTS
jgi:hypothetical protein